MSEPASPSEGYEVPFDTDAETATAEASPSAADAKETLNAGDQQQREAFVQAFEADCDPAAFDSASEPFIGQWQRLISSTNWEKGRIISQWRGALIEAGAHPTEYSDEAWARRAGGVTAPHVGRLRRVHDRFAKEHQSYPGLFWSHFLAALDWDDAPMWLEGAMREGWSVSQLREQRWQAQGGDPDQKPNPQGLAEVELDEDAEPMEPAQGGGGPTFDDSQPSGISTGPGDEGPDFGEEDDIAGVRDGQPSGATPIAEDDDGGDPAEFIQPFRDLPELPADLNEAVEAFKLAILRHKASNWDAVKAEDVVRYLVGLRMLVEAKN